MTTLHVSAIDPARLSDIGRNGHDESGHTLIAFPAEGWEPLHCGLTLAEADASIVLVAYTPFTVGSPWAETGPVFIHRDPCPGYGDADRLPAMLRTGPRVLKPYHGGGSLDYADITVVAEGQDIEASLLDRLDRPAVDVVHVRALAAQCFTDAVALR